MGHHGPGVVRLLLSLRLTVLPALQVLAEQAADAPRAFPTEYRTDNFEDASAWLNLDIARQGYAVVWHIAYSNCRGFFYRERQVAEEKLETLRFGPYAAALFGANGEILGQHGRYNPTHPVWQESCLEPNGSHESCLEPNGNHQHESSSYC